MNTLVIFVDMYRSDFIDYANLNTSNSPIAKSGMRINGDFYSNIFTHCPDTARSFITFLTGKPCFSTPNNLTSKYPFYFPSNNGLFTKISQEGYYVKVLSNRRHLFFPDTNVTGFESINTELMIPDRDNQFTFLDLPDVHLLFDDYGYNKRTLDLIHRRLDLFEKIESIAHHYDYIIYFSDHGMLFDHEKSFEDFIGPKRSKILCFIHNKDDTKVTINSSLTTLSELHDFIYQIHTIEHTTKPRLVAKNVILIEDIHGLSMRRVSVLPGIVTLIKNKNIYSLDYHKISDYSLEILKLKKYIVEDSLTFNETSHLNVIISRLEEKTKIYNYYQNYQLDTYTNGKSRGGKKYRSYKEINKNYPIIGRIIPKRLKNIIRSLLVNLKI